MISYLAHELTVAKGACLAAGRALSTSATASKIANEKNKDIKILGDTESEAIIVSHLLQHTSHPILSEESGLSSPLQANEPFWIVDPLDGSFNFHRGIPMACISVALWRDREPLLGVIYDFLRDELFEGIVGGQVTGNNKPLAVSAVIDTSKATLATGFPLHRDYSKAELTLFVQQVQHFKKIRMIGSAALSLAYVASGRFDAYEENGICLWDVAAGIALVKAAGGVVQFEPAQSKKPNPWQFNVRCAGKIELLNTLPNFPAD